MKRVLSIVLAVIMAFSVATVAFAVDAVEGRVYFGPKEEIFANPGEEVKFEIQFIADPFEETLDGVDKDGTFHIPLLLAVNEASFCPITKVELTDAAKAAGFTLTEGDAFDDYEMNGYTKESHFVGEVTVPAKYLFNKESVIALNVFVKVYDEWEIKDYVEQEELYLEVITGEQYIPSYVMNPGAEEGEEIYVNAEGDAAYIHAKPYEPNFFERVWEWIKERFRRVIALDNVVNTLLETYVFPKADWYDDYMNRKNAEKNAKDAAKEAEKAEVTIS